MNNIETILDMLDDAIDKVAERQVILLACADYVEENFTEEDTTSFFFFTKITTEEFVWALRWMAYTNRFPKVTIDKKVTKTKVKFSVPNAKKDFYIKLSEDPARQKELAQAGKIESELKKYLSKEKIEFAKNNPPKEQVTKTRFFSFISVGSNNLSQNMPNFLNRTYSADFCRKDSWNAFLREVVLLLKPYMLWFSLPTKKNSEILLRNNTVSQTNSGTFLPMPLVAEQDL